MDTESLMTPAQFTESLQLMVGSALACRIGAEEQRQKEPELLFLYAADGRMRTLRGRGYALSERPRLIRGSIADFRAVAAVFMVEAEPRRAVEGHLAPWRTISALGTWPGARVDVQRTMALRWRGGGWSLDEARTQCAAGFGEWVRGLLPK